MPPKKYMIIALVVVAVVAVGMVVLYGVNKSIKDYYINKPMNTSTDIKIELINNVDKRVLTDQGKQILSDIIKNENFVLQTANTDYGEWKEFVEKDPYVTITDKDEIFIIPLYRYTFHFYTNTNGEKRTDTLSLNGFELEKFLGSDPSVVVDFSVKSKSSYAVTLDGFDEAVSIKINGKEYINSDKKPWGGDGMFSVSIPVNKFLVVGENEIEILKSSASGELKVGVVETNKDKTIESQSVDAPSVILHLTIKPDEELEQQTSVFDW